MRRLRKNFHAKGVRAIILFAGGGGCPRLIFDNFHYVNIIGLNFLEAGGYEPSPSLELPPLVSAHLRWINAPLLLSWSASSYNIMESMSFACFICYMRGSRFFFNELGLTIISLIKHWQWPNGWLKQQTRAYVLKRRVKFYGVFQGLSLIGWGGGG